MTLPKAPGRHDHGFLKEALIAARYVWAHPSNRGRRLSTLARAAVFQIRGRLLHKPTLVPCGERSVIELLPSEGASGLVYANPPEFAEVGVWRRTLAPGDLFVDVGAHVGSYTIWACEQGAQVIAIEPDAQAATRLRRNLALNRFEAEVLEAAVADVPGEQRFTEGLGVLNHLAPRPGEPSRLVRTVTLDEVLGGRVAAGVKIDVEGAELLALRGAATALLEHRIKLLQLEWNPSSEANFASSRDEIVELLRVSGYALLRPGTNGDLLPLEHASPGPDVFARPAS